jgi:hypothetical protein
MRDGPAIRLRETPNAAPLGAQIIDAQFEVVAGRRGGVLGALWTACVAIFWAVLIGLLIPPVWMIAQRLLGG